MNKALTLNLHTISLNFIYATHFNFIHAHKIGHFNLPFISLPTRFIEGFLKPGLNDQTVANFGLLDIIAALQWIKENIEQFGGDRNSVTLLGYGK